MNALQLEFNFKCEDEVTFYLNLMNSKISDLDDSMGKVRRKLFSQVGEIHKLCLELKRENEILKLAIMELKNEEKDWTFGKKGTLFDVQQFKETTI